MTHPDNPMFARGCLHTSRAIRAPEAVLTLQRFSLEFMGLDRKTHSGGFSQRVMALHLLLIRKRALAMLSPLIGSILRVSGNRHIKPLNLRIYICNFVRISHQGRFSVRSALLLSNDGLTTMQVNLVFHLRGAPHQARQSSSATRFKASDLLRIRQPTSCSDTSKNLKTWSMPVWITEAELHNQITYPTTFGRCCSDSDDEGVTGERLVSCSVTGETRISTIPPPCAESGLFARCV